MKKAINQFKAKQIKENGQVFWKVSFKGDGGLPHLVPVKSKKESVFIFSNVELNTKTGIVTQY